MPAGTAGCWSGAFYPRGSSGSNGSFSAAAAGGSGASLSSGFGYTIASAGGNGGGWGENGVASVAGFCHSNSGGDYTNPGRAGGTSGRAVRINGYNLIFNIETGTSLLKDPFYNLTSFTLAETAMNFSLICGFSKLQFIPFS